MVTSKVSLWYKDHSTPNPLGVTPSAGTLVLAGSKFDPEGVRAIDQKDWAECGVAVSMGRYVAVCVQSVAAGALTLVRTAGTLQPRFQPLDRVSLCRDMRYSGTFDDFIVLAVRENGDLEVIGPVKDGDLPDVLAASITTVSPWLTDGLVVIRSEAGVGPALLDAVLAGVAAAVTSKAGERVPAHLVVVRDDVRRRVLLRQAASEAHG